ncbi:MFS transporter [Phytoactinopolyspora mesophila]|uniref:MFS transporter n=1 Tax=Phytoactinopolyspora mesophila TaxID=2650750 RepID=A0A7K3M4C7_9ACTN|nr:MFS transporter [Phytoactinopolyspora mesophila]NDL58105.1 MFS transporter [Phytoactinopolyspora mesophila]
MSRSDPPSQALRQVTTARNAVYLVFAVNGFGFASWMSRIPGVRDSLELTPGELGKLLLALAIGAVVALPTSGFVVGRIGAARTVALGSLLAGGGLIFASFGTDPMSSVVAVAIGLAALGYGTGSWDVAMNVEGAAVERLLEKNIMPRFHAAFSLGTVVGAGIGAGMTWLRVPVPVHLSMVGIIVIVVVALSVRHFMPLPADRDDARTSRAAVLRAWREPRTLVVGVMVLSFALIEGIANDWLAVGLVDGYDIPNAAGSAGFALFVTAMTIGRLSGSALLNMYGRLRVLRVSGALALIGASMVALGPSVPFAIVGIVIWGIGAALGFPIGMSAAADDPRRAAARVSVVSSIGYTAFLAGPPLLGWIGDHQGVTRALLVAAAAGALGAAVAASARKEEPEDTRVGS